MNDPKDEEFEIGKKVIQKIVELHNLRFKDTLVTDDFAGKTSENHHAAKWRHVIEVFGDDAALFSRKSNKKRVWKESLETKTQTPSKKHRPSELPDNTLREEWALVLAISEEGDRDLDVTSQYYINSDSSIRNLKLKVGQVGRALFDGINTYFICV